MPEDQNPKYTRSTNQFERDMTAAAQYVRTFESEAIIAGPLADVLYAVGCMFSEEGTTTEQRELLERVVRAIR